MTINIEFFAFALFMLLLPLIYLNMKLEENQKKLIQIIYTLGKFRKYELVTISNACTEDYREMKISPESILAIIDKNVSTKNNCILYTVQQCEWPWKKFVIEEKYLKKWKNTND